jgi:hypothetical protein
MSFWTDAWTIFSSNVTEVNLSSSICGLFSVDQPFKLFDPKLWNER